MLCYILASQQFNQQGAQEKFGLERNERPECSFPRFPVSRGIFSSSYTTLWLQLHQGGRLGWSGEAVLHNGV